MARPHINTQEFSTELAISLPLHIALDDVLATDFVSDDQAHWIDIKFQCVVLDESSDHHNKAFEGSFAVAGKLMRDPAFDVLGVVRGMILNSYQRLVVEGRS